MAAATPLIGQYYWSQPAQAAGPTMSLRVFADKGKSQLVCDKGALHRKCNILRGTSFSIDVVANTPPEEGYAGYRAALQFSSSLTLQQQPEDSENLWPEECRKPSELKPEPGRYQITCMADFNRPRSHYAGPLVNVQFLCDAQGSVGNQVDLVGGRAKFGSYYLTPFGTQILLKSVAKGDKQVADSVVINCVPPPPTPTRTPTPTSTPTPTRTPTPTSTPTDTPTLTPTATDTPTLTPTPTPTDTPTRTPKKLRTPAPTRTPPPTATPGGPAICPDVTGDGRVTVLDIRLMWIGLLFQRFGIVLSRYDVDRDGDIDMDDVFLVAAHFGQVCLPSDGKKD